MRNLLSIFILLFKLERGWSGSFHFLRGNALGLVSKSPARTVASHHNDLSDWSNFLAFQRIEGTRGAVHAETLRPLGQFVRVLRVTRHDMRIYGFLFGCSLLYFHSSKTLCKCQPPLVKFDAIFP